MDNVLGRPLFKFNQGGIGRMMQQLIAAGYDVSKLDESRIISLYDYVYGSGEGKDYVPAVSTYKAQGGPVKLAEGESVPRYQTGPSSLGKLFSRFMNPPNENVINSIRKQAKSYYFNALLPSKDGTGSYTMKQMEAAEKKANELAEMDVMAYLENFKSVDPMKKAKSENPILNYRDTYSEDDEGGFPTDVIVDEMKFHRAILNSPEFEDKMIDMDALNKKMFSLDAPTYQYLLNLPKKEQDKFVKKYVARNAQYDIERADDTASDYMKRRYGMAQGGMPNTTENVGIMDGVGIGAEALMAQEQAIDQAQDIGGLMSAIRGKPVNEEEARSELAELVGPEDAQATPDSVLALVQPVMELSKGQGIAQFVEEVESPETQTMAQGGPVKLANGLTPGMNMAPPGMMESKFMQFPPMPEGMIGNASTETQGDQGNQNQFTDEQYNDMINKILAGYAGADGQPSLTDPLFESMYQSKLPMYEKVYKEGQENKAAKANVLFQIAQIGLGLAQAPKPGEPADLMSRISAASQVPLDNIGKIAQGIETAKNQADLLAKSGALNSAETQYLKALDADLELQKEQMKQEAEANKIDNVQLTDVDGRKTLIYSQGGKFNEIDIGSAGKKYNDTKVIELEDEKGELGQYFTWLDEDGKTQTQYIGKAKTDKLDPDFFSQTSGQYLYLNPADPQGYTIDPGYVNKNGVLMLRQPDGSYAAAENIEEYQKLSSRSDAFTKPDTKLQAENLEGITTTRSAMTAGEQIIKSIIKNIKTDDQAIAGTAGYINRLITQAKGIGKDLTQGNFLNALLGSDSGNDFKMRLDETLNQARKGLSQYEANLGEVTAGDQQSIGIAQELLNPSSKGVLVGFDYETKRDIYGKEYYEVVNKQYKTLDDFNGNEEMFANQVRINALAYGLARSRKSNGRLNLDDLQRASSAINLDIGSQDAILRGLTEAVNELIRNGEKFISGYYQAGGTQINPNWEVFGLTVDQQKALKDQITKEGVIGTYFPDAPIDIGERVGATSREYNVQDFYTGAQGNMDVKEVKEKLENAPVYNDISEIANQYGLGN